MPLFLRNQILLFQRWFKWSNPCSLQNVNFSSTLRWPSHYNQKFQEYVGRIVWKYTSLSNIYFSFKPFTWFVTNQNLTLCMVVKWCDHVNNTRADSIFLRDSSKCIMQKSVKGISKLMILWYSGCWRFMLFVVYIFVVSCFILLEQLLKGNQRIQKWQVTSVIGLSSL